MLRHVQEDDLPVMRRWRNHPRVREVSFNTHPIAEEEHARWWEGVRADDDRRVMIYDHEGSAAGVVTFNGVKSDIAYWGYYLDLDGLEQSGALLRAWVGLERAAIEHAFGPLGLTILRGSVLSDNEAVRCLHRRFGFAEVDTYQRVIDGVRRDIVCVQLTKEDA
ncbi:GNAT family N-acetyltransferase [Nonomuraea sp. K274]|uniref:GNAT family N-acetyltransferase n=1 Tax=Nonomuraea cypriaca TaxID=1187855 RepID=A0A931A9T1_9ACTN|nr:GNAT family N-acetyltransferase [Nonomuraea cypriaca]MBF8187635.1 GNAT family N-acetyltransferase [Nonomuraea cypriaca]